MKKLKLIIVALTCIVYMSSAQETMLDKRNALAVGLKVGTNYSNVYDSQGDKFAADSKFGFVAGGFLNIPLGTFVGLHPEVLFSEKGFHATGGALGLTYDFTRTTRYIDVPLLLELKPSAFISILGGPHYSYLLNQDDVFSSSITSVERQKDFTNDNIRKNIFGITTGIDINISSFVMSVRASWDLQNNNPDGTSTTPRYRNAWLQGTVGYKF